MAWQKAKVAKQPLPVRKLMKNHFLLALAALIIMFSACNTSDNAQTVVDKTIEAHGGDGYKNLQLSYSFRDKHYTLSRKEGHFTYTRAFEDSTGKVKDILTNERFVRLVNGDTVSLTEERKQAFTNSVNSVHYFALLPYGLNDPAVQKTYVRETTIKGTPYHLVKVTFEKEGGGVDFEDQFLYWINANTYTMDYLAYSYKTEGGGVRFREAVNPRQVGGIRFQDYINYKPVQKETPLDSMESLYTRGELEVLSKIELENIQLTAD